MRPRTPLLPTLAATALAAAIAGSLGPLAPYAIPPLGFLAGMVTGSNVGAASSLMAVQAGLGLAVGLPPWLAPRRPATCASRSAWVMRPAGPLPCTNCSSMPRSQARWRTAGAASGFSPSPRIGAGPFW